LTRIENFGKITSLEVREVLFRAFEVVSRHSSAFGGEQAASANRIFSLGKFYVHKKELPEATTYASS